MAAEACSESRAWWGAARRTERWIKRLPIQDIATCCVLKMSVAPFKPVTKSDAAQVLGICTKSIDNYIRDGLLPQPARFAGRDLWHPDDFYGFLSAKLRSGQTTSTVESVHAEPEELALEASSGNLAVNGVRRSRKGSAMIDRLRAINAS